MPELPPEEQRLSKRQAIALLRPEIERLQSQGYGLERLVEVLGENGIAIRGGTLKVYLRTSSREGQGAGRRKRRETPQKRGSAPQAKDGGNAQGTTRETPTERDSAPQGKSGGNADGTPRETPQVVAERAEGTAAAIRPSRGGFAPRPDVPEL